MHTDLVHNMSNLVYVNIKTLMR